MRIRVSDRSLVGELVEFLGRRPDCVVAQVAPDEVEANLLGSYRLELARLELDLRLRLWRASHPDVEVELVDGPPDATSALAS